MIRCIEPNQNLPRKIYRRKERKEVQENHTHAQCAEGDVIVLLYVPLHHEETQRSTE